MAHPVGPLSAKQYATQRSVTRGTTVAGSRYDVAVTGSRDDFPNHFVGDLVHTDCVWVVVPRPAARTATPTATWLVSQFGVVYVQRPTHGLAFAVAAQYSTSRKCSTGLLQRPAGVTKKIRTGG